MISVTSDFHSWLPVGIFLGVKNATARNSFRVSDIIGLRQGTDVSVSNLLFTLQVILICNQARQPWLQTHFLSVQGYAHSQIWEFLLMFSGKALLS